ncbi:hypothetical protein DVH05_002707 [Phytophthora capsici]|nr:hypothetical protein DVH05_002707 [Phytophthora capsici]
MLNLTRGPSAITSPPGSPDRTPTSQGDSTSAHSSPRSPQATGHSNDGEAAPQRLSVQQYHREHRRRHGSGSTSQHPGGSEASSSPPRTRQSARLDELEQGEFVPDDDEESPTHQEAASPRPSSPAPRSRELRTPNPFPNRDGSANAMRNAPPLSWRYEDVLPEPGVVSNDLDGAQSRQLEAASAIRASFSETDIRLERRLRLDFAKRQAKRRVPGQRPSRYEAPRPPPLAVSSPTHSHGLAVTATGQSLSSAIDLSSPHSSGGKRVAAGDSVARPAGGPSPGDVDHKRQRRQGNPAVMAPRTPMSSGNEGKLAILPDTGFDPGACAAPSGAPRDSGDPHAHRAEQEEAERPMDSRAASRDELLNLQTRVRSVNVYVADVNRSSHRLANGLEEVERRLDWLVSPQAMQQRVVDLERQVAQLQGQLDLLVRVQPYGPRTVAMPPPMALPPAALQPPVPPHPAALQPPVPPHPAAMQLPAAPQFPAHSDPGAGLTSASRSANPPPSSPEPHRGGVRGTRGSTKSFT